MRKKLLNQILNRCKINELIIDKEKAYLINVEVSDMNIEEISRFMQSIIKLFKKKLKLNNCIFIPILDGKSNIKIRELTQEEIENIPSE